MTAPLTPNPSHLFFLQKGHERCLCDRPMPIRMQHNEHLPHQEILRAFRCFHLEFTLFAHKLLSRIFGKSPNPKAEVGEGGGRFEPGAACRHSSMTAPLTPNPSHLFFLQKGHERCLCDRPMPIRMQHNEHLPHQEILRAFRCFHLEFTLFAHKLLSRIFGKSPNSHPPKERGGAAEVASNNIEGSTREALI